MLVIKKWTETFENSDSRKRQRLGWFLNPSGCESAGYIELMSHGERGVLAFGVFQAICQWSATNRQTVRGKLARSDGSALNVRQIAAFVRIPETIVNDAIKLLCSKDVGWLVDLDNENTASAEDCNQSATNLPLVADNLPRSADNLPALLKEKEKEKKTQSDRFTESDEQTAKHIWELIQKAFPNQRKPNLKSWADTIRKMRELDKLADDQIRMVFEWANSDDFWRPNILSPTKLRDKWNTLAARAEEKKPARKILPGTPEWSARSIQWLDKVPEWQAMANRGEITDQEFNRRVNEARMNADKDME